MSTFWIANHIGSGVKVKVNIGNLEKKKALTLDLQKAQLTPLMTSVPSHYGPTMSHHGTTPIFSRKKMKKLNMPPLVIVMPACLLIDLYSGNPT